MKYIAISFFLIFLPNIVYADCLEKECIAHTCYVSGSHDSYSYLLLENHPDEYCPNEERYIGVSYNYDPLQLTSTLTGICTKWVKLPGLSWSQSHSSSFTPHYLTNDSHCDFYVSDPNEPPPECPVCDLVQLQQQAEIACGGQFLVLSVDPELCTFECKEITCEQTKTDCFEYCYGLYDVPAINYQCSEDQNIAVSAVCECSDCSTSFSDCQTGCEQIGAKVLYHECFTDQAGVLHEDCQCSGITCESEMIRCNRDCEDVKSFICNPADPENAVCTCEEGLPGDQTYNKTPPDFDNTTTNNPEQSDPGDTIESSNNKLVDNTAEIISNQNSLADLIEQSSEFNGNQLQDIADNTRITADNTQELADGSHIISTDPLDQMGQILENELSETSLSESIQRETSVARSDEVGGWWSSISSTVYDVFQCTDSCEDIVIDVPGRSETLTIDADAMGFTKQIFRWIVYISTFFCIVGMLLSIGPTGNEPHQTVKI